VRFPTLTAALIGCAAAFGAASDDTDSAGRPPWRVYKVSPLTWNVTRTVESELPDGTPCHTQASLRASSDAFFVGTPATRRVTSYGVRVAKTRSAFAYGKRVKWPFTVPARMTLTVGQTTCDGPGEPENCAGTYHSVGGVIGYIRWSAAESRRLPSALDWSHKIARADKRPPMTCGRGVGEPVYELFFGGFYFPVGGGVFRAEKKLPLRRSQLVAGRRFTSTTTGVGDTDTIVLKATFVPVRAPR
jgi:hypothetical protein